MGKQRVISIIVGLSLFGAAVVLWGRSEPVPPEPVAANARPVRVDIVEKRTFDRQVRFSGITRARRRAMLSFTVPARMASRPVRTGQPVKSGDVIARLDDEPFRNALCSAEARLAECKTRVSQAARDHRRILRLVAEKAAPEEELEKVVAAHDALKAGEAAARAQCEEAMRQLRETVLKAPFSGTITAVYLEPGEWASPGRPVVEISGAGDLEIEIQVPETVLAGLRMEQPVNVVLPFAGTGTGSVDGRIVLISGAASGPGRLFPVRIQLAGQQGIVAGMTAEITVQVAAEDQLSVPLKAVVNPGGGVPVVFRLANNQVQRLAVALGAIADGRVAVAGSLKAGDHVVIEGQTALVDGDGVEVVP